MARRKSPQLRQILNKYIDIENVLSDPMTNYVPGKMTHTTSLKVPLLLVLLLAPAMLALTTAPSLPRASYKSGRSYFDGHIFCSRIKSTPLGMCKNDDIDGKRIGNKVNETAPPETVIRVDDGGSDLTNRFKYKVNALMGVYDPTVGADDENQEGNILNAMLTFPAPYAFNVVGRTNNEDNVKEQFIQDVKRIVSGASSDADSMEWYVTPRGTAFTKVTAQVLVESASVINSTYAELKNLDLVVMAY